MGLKPESIKARLTKKLFNDVSKSLDPLLRQQNYALQVEVLLDGKAVSQIGVKQREAETKTGSDFLPGMANPIEGPSLQELIEIDSSEEDLLTYISSVNVTLTLDQSTKDQSAKKETETLIKDTIHSSVDPLGTRSGDQLLVQYADLSTLKGTAWLNQPVQTLLPMAASNAPESTDTIQNATRKQQVAKGRSAKLSAGKSKTPVEAEEVVFYDAITHQQTSARIGQKIKSNRAAKNRAGHSAATVKSSPAVERNTAPVATQHSAQHAKQIATPEVATQTTSAQSAPLPVPATPSQTVEPTTSTVQTQLTPPAQTQNWVYSPAFASLILTLGLISIAAFIVIRLSRLKGNVERVTDSLSQMPITLSEGLRNIAQAVPKTAQAPVIITQPAPNDAQAVFNQEPVAANSEKRVAPQPGNAAVHAGSAVVHAGSAITKEQLFEDPKALAQTLRGFLKSGASKQTSFAIFFKSLSASQTRALTKCFSLDELQFIEKLLERTGVPTSLEKVQSAYLDIASQLANTLLEQNDTNAMAQLMVDVPTTAAGQLLGALDLHTAAALMATLPPQIKETWFSMLSEQAKTETLEAMSQIQAPLQSTQLAQVLTQLASICLSLNLNSLLIRITEESKSFLQSQDHQSLIRAIRSSVAARKKPVLSAI